MLLFFAALVAFATFDAGAKRLLEHYPAPFLNVVRYVAVATLALFLLWRAGRPRLRDAPHKAAGAARPDAGHRRHLLHDGADLDAAVRSHRHLFHVAADHGGAVALAAGERVRAAQWAAVAVGFAGMLLIVRPGADLPWLGTLLMAVSAVSYAVFQVLTRKLAGPVPGPVQYAYTALICLIATALPAPFFLPDPGRRRRTWR